MSQKIRLTESELINVIKRVIKEQGRGRDEVGDLNFEFNDKLVFLRDLNQKKVQDYLSKLPETIVFLAIRDCEAADFSNVDLCSFPELHFVNLKGTPNNMEENVGCEFKEVGNGLYDFQY